MPPYRIEWLDEAKIDVRSVLPADHYAPLRGSAPVRTNGSGDVKTLHGDMAGAFRFRLGDYRVLFPIHQDTIRIFGVRHRSEAYSKGS